MAENPTYHVDIWANPPTYVCLLCVGDAAQARYSLEGVTAHLQTEHQAQAISTPYQESLLAFRNEAMAEAARTTAAATTATQATTVASETPSVEVAEASPALPTEAQGPEHEQRDVPSRAE